MTACVSVVIPTYNRANLISETLRAVLQQTMPAAEIIVVDDGSTDDTSHVVASFGETVRFLRIQNSGDLVARNIGLRAASSPLVAFCDSDDLWLPGFLSIMTAKWKTEPQLLACYSNFRLLRDGVLSNKAKFDDAPEGFWATLRQTDPSFGIFDHPFTAKLLEFQPFFPSCMLVSRTAFLALGGWDEGVSRVIGCDFATALRVAAHPPVGVVHCPLVAIRKHRGNVSADTEQMNLGDALVLEHVLRTRAELSTLRSAIQSSIAWRRSDALSSAFSRRDFAKVDDIYKLLPNDLITTKERVKHAIAKLPGRLAILAASMLSR